MQIFKDPIKSCLLKKTLNKFISLEKQYWIQTRNDLRILLNVESVVKECITNKKLKIPVVINNYTDFYSNQYHASNMSMIYRTTRTILQNWYTIPIGYNGRCSSIITADDFDIVNIHRPKGQMIHNDKIVYCETSKLDFELEVGIIVGGKCNKIGEVININDANDNIFGYVILNDLSARDIQKYEYVPLGPLNGKNFSTLISPWIITELALEPYKCIVPIDSRMANYLIPKTSINYTYPIELIAEVNGIVVTKTNYNTCYWSPTQLITHITSSGSNLLPGDLLGSGTISNGYIGINNSDEMGSLAEITFDGIDGNYLSNGDVLKISAVCGNVSLGHITCKITK